MDFLKAIKYLRYTKNDHYLYFTLSNYQKYKWLLWILIFNKNYRSCRIYRKKHKYHTNIVVVGLKYYGRNVKRRTSGFTREYLTDNPGIHNHCIYCNTTLTEENITADHIIPVSKGGNNSKINLIPCCKTCNEERGDEEFYKYLFQKQPKFLKMKYPFI